MSVLFNLPDVQQIGVLCEWLTITSIQTLDNAVCSKQYRPLYLSIIQSELCSLPAPEETSDKLISWSMARRVNHSKISTNRSLQIDGTLRRSFLQICGKNASTIIWVCDLGDDRPAVQDTRYVRWDALYAPEILADIATHCPQLRTFIITLAKPHGVNLDGSISILLNACSRLRTIRVEHKAKPISGPRVTHTFGIKQAFLNALYEAQGLEEIVLNQCDLDTWPADVGQAAVSVVQNTTVKSLVLQRICEFYRVKEQECVIRHFPNLTHLDAQLKTEEWHAVAEYLPHMRCVAFNNIDFQTISLRTILPKWKNLEDLRMGPLYPHANYICTVVELAPMLQRLYINGSNRIELLSEVRSRRLPALTPRLEFPAGYSGSRLRELHVAVSELATAGNLQMIFEKCPYLHVLSLFDFSHFVSADCLDAFGMDVCPVKVLYINQGCQARNTVTDAQLQEVRGLHEFYVNKKDTQKSLITTEGIRGLVKRCPDLRVLYLKDALSVSKATQDVLPILEACPLLNVLEFPSTPPLVDADTAYAASRAGRSTRGVSKAKAAVAGPPPPDPTELFKIIKEQYPNLWHVAMK